MTEAFKDNKISYNLHVAKDGEIAIQMLYQQNKPDLIQLDFNPKINGLDLLIKLKETPNLAEIPL
jgi:CheY-like chemotaxis protein